MTQEPRVHPAAALFPLIEGDEFRALVESIRTNGQVHPIVLDDEGRVLDGRNRLRACTEARVVPKFTRYDGDDPVRFVISCNVHRRHLDGSQRAIIAVEMAELRAELAAAARARKGKRTDLEEEPARTSSHESPGSKSGRVSDQIGELMGVSGRYVDEARTIKDKAPEAWDEIKEGKRKISQVRRDLRRQQLAEQSLELPKGKYRVVYADCPWKYGDDRSGLKTSAAEDHYPTMSVADLCALPVADLAAENCVLFFWATCPLLPDAMQVVKAWGFKYKTCFVWDKSPHHNVGNYHEADAELLLVATLGSCLPEERGGPQVKRIPRAEHSRKPDDFRDLIDRMYKVGPRIELFCRGEVPEGWEAWGNEAQEAQRRLL